MRRTAASSTRPISNALAGKFLFYLFNPYFCTRYIITFIFKHYYWVFNIHKTNCGALYDILRARDDSKIKFKPL